MKIKQVQQEGKTMNLILFEDATHLILLDCAQTKASNTESALVSHSFESRRPLQDVENMARLLQENTTDKRVLEMSDQIFASNKFILLKSQLQFDC